jgi:transposase
MYERGGGEALRAKPIPGRPRKVEARIEQCVEKIVRTQTPQDWGFFLALWTRAQIGSLIADVLGVRLCLASVGNLLARRGLSCQRPLHRAYEQNAQRVERWISQEFPAIRERARAQGAVIMFADESRLRSDYHRGTTWAPIGHTPVIRATGKRFSWNMFCAIACDGTMRYQINDDKLNSSRFILFLKHLLRGIKRKIILIVDNYSAHCSAQTRDFVSSTQGRLELVFRGGPGSLDRAISGGLPSEG